MIILVIVYHEKIIKWNCIHILMEKHSFHKYFWAVIFYFFLEGGGGGGGWTNHRVFHLCGIVDQNKASTK